MREFTKIKPNAPSREARQRAAAMLLVIARDCDAKKRILESMGVEGSGAAASFATEAESLYAVANWLVPRRNGE